MNNSPDDVTYEMKVTLWVIGRVEELKTAGLVRGDPVIITPRGIGLYDQLAASGFRPPECDVRLAMAAIHHDSSADALDDDLVALVMHYKEPS